MGCSTVEDPLITLINLAIINTFSINILLNIGRIFFRAMATGQVSNSDSSTHGFGASNYNHQYAFPPVSVLSHEISILILTAALRLWPKVEGGSYC